MTKEIQLTQGKIALVDDDDFEKVNQYKWCAAINGNTYYALHQFKDEYGKQKMISMHRFIMELPETKKIDHIDGNGLNNKKNNLRYCNRSENTHNMKVKRKNNTTGYKGVSYCPEYNKSNPYTAHIGFNGKLIHIGYFKTKKLAALAYNKKAKELFGEFARLNKII